MCICVHVCYFCTHMLDELRSLRKCIAILAIVALVYDVHPFPCSWLSFSLSLSSSCLYVANSLPYNAIQYSPQILSGHKYMRAYFRFSDVRNLVYNQQSTYPCIFTMKKFFPPLFSLLLYTFSASAARAVAAALLLEKWKKMMMLRHWSPLLFRQYDIRCAVHRHPDSKRNR